MHSRGSIENRVGSLSQRKAREVPKILIAEDSYALANLLEFVLKRSGFEVRVARHGAQALGHAEQYAFDTIVLDQQMPGMTGIEVLTKIRAGGLNQNTPVYLCTAKTHELQLGKYNERRDEHKNGNGELEHDQ